MCPSTSSYPAYFSELYELSEGRALGLAFAHFAEALLSVGRRFLPPTAAPAQISRFYRSLHLKDLALAQACSQGSEAAWQCFLSRYHDKLYSAALVVAKNDSIARDLSESISGELFQRREGTNEAASCKLASYSGRGSLEGWLKAILANAYVDRYRSQRKVLSLDQRIATIGMACLSQPPTQERTLRYGNEPDFAGRLHRAIDEALSQRTPEQRFVLAAYFFDGWTLSEIAKRLTVHESTVSRRIDRTLRELRASIVRSLRDGGMSPRQIEEVLRSDIQDLPFELRGALLHGISFAQD